jgi:hypothetical protein
LLINSLGQVEKVLANEFKNAGSHLVEFDGRVIYHLAFIFTKLHQEHSVKLKR